MRVLEMLRRRKLPLAAAALLTCTGGVGLATALGSGAGAPASGPLTNGTPALNALAQADFSVFGRPAGGSEEVALAEKALTGLGVQLDPSSVRLAQEADGLQVRVAGNSEVICLSLRIAGQADAGGCAPVAHAASPPTPIIVSTEDPPGAEEAAGVSRAVAVLLPDGTSATALRTPSGATSTLAVTGNSVAFVAKPGDTISWVGPEGTAYSAPVGG